MAENENNGDAAERARLLKVYRVWKTATLERALGWWFGVSSLRTILAGLVTIFAAVLLPLDGSLWGTRPFFGELLPRSGRLISIAFLATCLVSTLLVARWLWQISRRPRRGGRWVRASLTLLGGIPILGLLVVPVWRTLQDRLPVRVPHRRPEVLAVDLARQQTSRHLLRLLDRTRADFLIVALLLIGQITVLLLTSLWLSREVMERRVERRYVLDLCLGLHLLLFLILFFLGLRSGRLGGVLPRRQQRLLVAATFLCLLPIPLSPLAGSLPMMILEPGMTRSWTLLWQALVRRKESGRLPLWLELEESLQPGWGKLPWHQRIRNPPKSVTRQPGLGPVEVRTLMLYDLGVLALALDAACLGWCVSWLAGRSSAAAPVLERFSEGGIFGALLVSAAALSVSTIHLVLRLLRISGPLSVLDRQPYALYAAKAPFALAAGLFFGREICQADPSQVGILLMYFISVLILLKGYSLIVTGLKPKARWRGPWPWNETVSFLALFLLMIVCGLGGPLELLPKGLALWLLTWPFRVLLLGRWLLPSLLRPFAKSDALAVSLPLWLRLDIAILLLSATLPFGALAIPWCVYIRDRHWPEARALWTKAFRDQPRNLEAPDRSLANYHFERSF
jgi:hypothetical protein